jgi:hypothetical protein
MICEYCGENIKNLPRHLEEKEFCKNLNRRRLVRDVKRYLNAAKKSQKEKPAITIRWRAVK